MPNPQGGLCVMGAVFVAEGGIECLTEQQEALQACANSTRLPEDADDPALALLRALAAPGACRFALITLRQRFPERNLQFSNKASQLIAPNLSKALLVHTFGKPLTAIFEFGIYYNFTNSVAVLSECSYRAIRTIFSSIGNQQLSCRLCLKTLSLSIVHAVKQKIFS